ncbi:hypothetical protein K402DRAFT_239303 [Aulographum hederae CBS 113979]|uniref:Uncharacterized protein n=1 Tax=Aulographum hederae CBS 113979 TaxID=1176131 RepID=A0A6G1GK37_9PEZI|nr:hypothetical protein K402DRAFT_239303 [Aulographum hederae CBS 113979]
MMLFQHTFIICSCCSRFACPNNKSILGAHRNIFSVRGGGWRVPGIFTCVVRYLDGLGVLMLRPFSVSMGTGGFSDCRFNRIIPAVFAVRVRRIMMMSFFRAYSARACAVVGKIRWQRWARTSVFAKKSRSILHGWQLLCCQSTCWSQQVCMI